MTDVTEKYMETTHRIIIETYKHGARVSVTEWNVQPYDELCVREHRQIKKHYDDIGTESYRLVQEGPLMVDIKATIHAPRAELSR